MNDKTTTDALADQTAEGRAILTSILERCPHAEPNSACHLCEVRRLSNDEQDAWVANLDPEEVAKWTRRHTHCFWWNLGDR